ncbi:MAG: M20 family metallo-hydrolase [Alphaproteobacteria bacterium]|nr:M20 family metallo-hydrolase [Alphaproteobacteria bacterium]
MTTVAARVDEKRLWTRHVDMAKIGATPAGGVNRFAFTPEDTEARKLLLTWAEKRDFKSEIDDLGNIFIRRAGTDKNAPPVVSGSHSDTQPKGGRFDGIYGVLAAFEVLEALEDGGIKTKRPLEAVIWSAEEGGSRFPMGCLGSQAYADPKKAVTLLDGKDNAGMTVKAAIAEMMKGLPKLGHRPLNTPLAYCIEAHIEQGPILEETKNTIGVVTAIHGQRWFKVEVIGEAGHAGNTPERLRKDAVTDAIPVMAALRKLFHDPDDVVRFTMGRVDVEPNATAVIPAKVTFTIDFRHPDEATITRLGDQVEAVAKGAASKCEVKVTQLRRAKTTPFTGAVPETILAVTKKLGYPHMHIPSGAGHDARYIADICPTGMIFIPCWKGISHNETEDATAGDLAAGTRVLAETMVELANR